MKLGEVCILTKDVKGMADFYKAILNVTNDSEDSVHQTILSEEPMLTIYNEGSINNNQNQSISIAFTVDDVDKEYEKLLQLGVNIIEKPTTRPWGARNMHFCDPDGNHIYFRSFSS